VLDEIVQPRANGVEETRLRIFDATRRLYAAKGSRGTTTREIAGLAGVNEATIFRHFGTKRELIDAMLEHFNGANAIPEILAGLATYDSVAAQLTALAHAGIEIMRRKEDLIKVSLAEEIASPNGELCAWRSPSAARASLIRYFDERIAARELRGDSKTLARAFMSFVFAFVMARTLLDDPTLTQDKAVTEMVDLFLDGARAR